MINERDLSNLQELVDFDSMSCGARVTVTIDFVIEKGMTHMTPEDLFKEWFEKFALNIRTHGHAFRDASIVGNSDANIEYVIVKKTK